jgi:hypothetical protein
MATRVYVDSETAHVATSFSNVNRTYGPGRPDCWPARKRTCVRINIGRRGASFDGETLCGLGPRVRAFHPKSRRAARRSGEPRLSLLPALDPPKRLFVVAASTNRQGRPRNAHLHRPRGRWSASSVRLAASTSRGEVDQGLLPSLWGDASRPAPVSAALRGWPRAGLRLP